jgi:drug/metabolite transporter (DMT)-like permease
MKSIIFAIFATILYAVSGVIIEQKLEKFNTIPLTLLFTLAFIPLGLGILTFQKFTHQEIKFPTHGLLWLTLAMGAFYFLADYFYIGAFTAGGNVIVITTIIVIAPVIAALFKHLWTGSTPNAYQVVGYLLAATSVLLITRYS